MKEATEMYPRVHFGKKKDTYKRNAREKRHAGCLFSMNDEA